MNLSRSSMCALVYTFSPNSECGWMVWHINKTNTIWFEFKRKMNPRCERNVQLYCVHCASATLMPTPVKCFVSFGRNRMTSRLLTSAQGQNCIQNDGAGVYLLAVSPFRLHRWQKCVHKMIISLLFGQLAFLFGSLSLGANISSTFDIKWIATERFVYYYLFISANLDAIGSNDEHALPLFHILCSDGGGGGGASNVSVD